MPSYTEGPVHEVLVLPETSKAGHHRYVSETPLEWRFTDGPMVTRHCVLARLFARLRRTGTGAPTQSMEADVVSDEKLVLYGKWTVAQAHV